MARRRIRAADLFRLVIPHGITLDAARDRIAFCVKSGDLKQNRYRSHLYLLALRGGRPRQLTQGDVNDSGPVFSPNGRWLAFVSRRGEQEAPQIWVLPLEGGEPRALTALPGGPVRDLRWSPDGRRILFGHRREPRVDPEERRRGATYKHITQLWHKLDGDGFFPAARWHLYTAAFPSGRVHQVTRGAADDFDASWSPDGKRIAFVSNRRPDAETSPDNDDLFVVSTSGRGLRQLTQRYGTVAAPAWSLDGQALYYAGHFGRRGEFLRHPYRIYRQPLAGGRLQALSPPLDQWPFNRVIADTVRSAAGELSVYRDPETGAERIAFYSNEHGACRLYSLPAAPGGGRGRDGGARTGASRRAGRARGLRLELGGKVNTLALAHDPETGHAAALVARLMDCGDVYRLRLDGRDAPERLTELNRALLRRLDLTEPEETIFSGRANGQTPVHGWVLKPPGFRRNRRYPMILNIHGGPMGQFGYTLFHEMHYLAAQGYVVVFTNPRGSSGYGLRFMNCIENRWGKLDYADLMAVTDAMVRRPYVDGRRLGVTGGSYGGFMTTWIVGHTQRFRAAVTQRQVGSVLTQAGSSDFGFYRIYSRGQLPWREPMKYLRDSPNFYADAIRTPLLIIHSEQDLRCPIAQSEELFTWLKVLGRTVEMVRFEGESHGLSRGGRPQNRRERLERIAGWFERYL